MEVKISLVPQWEIMNIWPQVKDLLAKATDQSEGRYEIQDLCDRLCTGEFHLWIVFTPAFEVVAAITSTFTIYPQGKFLSGQFLGGDHLEKWKESFCQVFSNWGRDNKCKAIEFTGRAGWVKVLADQGYREVYRVLQKDLT